MKHIRQSITRVALGATFLFATMLMAMPSKALDCKNINVIFMRGSSQNYAPKAGDDSNFPKWSFIGDQVQFKDPRTEQEIIADLPTFANTEKESLKYFKSIGDRVHADFPSLSMQFVSLHDIAGKYNQNGYKAVSAFGSYKTAFVSKNALDAKFGDLSIVQDVTGDVYNQSINDGSEELAGYLEDQMTSCPSQYNVVGGFSQGAHVVGEAMRKMHDRGQDNLLSRLGHVDLYGDPKFNGFDLLTSRINPLQKHSTLPWTRGTATTNHAGAIGPRKPYIPDILTSKTTSWCDKDDIVCGGIGAMSSNYDAHGEVYNAAEGWIEKSANEIYIDLKTRLALLAGLTDTSANSPLAYWNGIKHPKKIDIMFVMDRTGDETLSLSPEADYLARNFKYLADSKLSSIMAGVVTYTETSRFNGTKDVIEPQVKTVSNLSADLYGDYSYFKSTWGPAHSQNPPFGGADLQDSPFSAISTALDQKYWREDSRKVIVLFSNTWGKDIEDTTNLTLKQVTAKARAKDVEILPVFTSKTFRANASRVDFIPTANAFWNKLAKGSGGHYTEVSDLISEKLVYDVIMGHVHAPDVEITTGKTYNTPSTSSKKVAKSTTIKNTKPVLKKGKKVTLSATKSNAPKSKVKTYAWDTNGDGVIDETSTLPDIEFTPDAPFDGTITVTVTDEAGNSTTGQQDIQITDDDSMVTHQEPAQLVAPVVSAVRSGNNVVLTWQPTEGSLVFMHDDNSVLAVVDASLGTFTITDAPTTAFDLLAQLTNGNELSDTAQVHIDAAPNPVPTQQATSANNPPTTDNGAQVPQTIQDAQPVPIAPLQSSTTPPLTQQALVARQNPQVLGLAVTAPQSQDVPVVYKLQSPVFTFAKLNVVYNPSGLADSIKFIFWTAIFAVWPDMTLLLILLLLLLIMLDISLRDHRKQQYKHDQQYDYKPLLTNTYKV